MAEGSCYYYHTVGGRVGGPYRHVRTIRTCTDAYELLYLSVSLRLLFEYHNLPAGVLNTCS